MQKIAPAFIKAKKEFAPAMKDKSNPAFRSKYADLGACLEAVEDALLNNEIALYQETFDDSTGVTVETVLLHSSGETIRGGKLHVPAAKQDPQGYGSALTYARRYSLMTACGIAPEDDDGNAASKPRAQQAPAKVDLSAFLSAMDKCETVGQLQEAFATAWKASAGNASVKAHYEKLKAKLIEGAPA